MKETVCKVCGGTKTMEVFEIDKDTHTLYCIECDSPIKVLKLNGRKEEVL